MACALSTAFLWATLGHAGAVATDTRPPKVLVVLDVSGSMALPAGNGLTRLDAARRALAELLGTLPRGSRVGIRVYGSTYAGKDRSRSCADTRLQVPIGIDRPGQIMRAVAGLRPTGDTPIARALKFAASDLQTSPEPGRPVVVLISDGQDNCSPAGHPPCSVVRALQNTGFKVRIETVGVALGNRGPASDELHCIAERTGGQYYDAKNSDALSAALERISSDTLGGVGAGRATRVAPDRRQAPLITPGAYRVDMRPGQSAWFRFRAAAGQDPRVLTTIEGLDSLTVPVADRNCPAWSVQLFNPYGEGGSYPPYGNTAAFDGVGVGAAGASTTGRLDPYSEGIDFPGQWMLRLSFAAKTLTGCSAPLPQEHAFPVRFLLQSSAPALEASAGVTAGPASGPPSPQTTTRPSTAAGPDPGLAAKYDDPVRSSAPTWVAPAVAVAVICGLGGLGAAFVAVRRRRRRGW